MLKITLIVLLFLSFGAGNTFAATTPKSAEPLKLNERQQRSLERYQKLIAYRSAAGHDQVLPMAEFLAAEFRIGGFSENDIHLMPMKDTAALVVRYRGVNNSNIKPIMLMAHMDVVDALPKDWERDPFTLIEEDGYYYGRGTSDNKAGVANLTAAFLQLRAEGFIPSRDFIIVFSGDEETTGHTIKTLLSEHRALVDAEYALNADGGGGSIGEGGKVVSFSMQTAEKTYMTFTLTATNPGGHSSMPRPDNAIHDLASAISKLSQYKFPVRQNETTKLYFERRAPFASGELSAAMSEFAKDPSNTSASDYLAKDGNYVGMTRTTCISTMLKAGHAENALPQSATATVNCRVWPDEDMESVKRRIETAIDDTNVNVELLDGYSMSPPSELRPDLVRAITKVVHKRHPGIPLIPYMAPYFTDGKFTRGEGIPTYGIGGLSLGADDARAHGLDERVPVWSFFEEADYWYDLIQELSR
ncbi:MAG: M20/M25/M40 family metallo-hydrolase [Pseudomonadota bacterium]